MRYLLWSLTAVTLLACGNSKPTPDDGTLDTGGLSDLDGDSDGYTAAEDCDDSNSVVHPGAAELCDGVDNDCDGAIDEDVATTFYADTDGDGFGDASSTAEGCEAPAGYVPNGNDCDDASAESYPGAPERCDSADNDCDGIIDEDVTTTFYADGDGDGYGDPLSAVEDCDPASGYVANADDCDDTSAASFPGGEEICDTLDNNCDGTVDEGVTTTYYVDADADGYGQADATTEACYLPTGYASIPGDCDDTSDAISPAAAEVCNTLDDNCDGSIDEGVTTTFYADTDADGYGDATSTVQACAVPSGYVSDATDCDDAEADANPGEVEVCDGIDNDCDCLEDYADGSLDPAPRSVFYADTDGDGYGDAGAGAAACVVPSGYVSDATDCDDTEAGANPGEDEVCDSIDNDCDGTADEPEALDAETFYADADGDGYGDETTAAAGCAAPSGYVDDDTDCDDTDADVHPAAEDRCNGVDDDCDESIDEDALSGVFLASLYGGYFYEIDVGAGTSTALFTPDSTATGSYSSNSIASSLEGGPIYIHDSGDNRLLSLDTCDESLSEIGETTVGNTCGIAIGPDGDLYGIDTNNDTLVRFDVSTGEATEIGDLGFDLMNCGLAYDCTNDTLIGMQVDTTDNTGLLFSIDVDSGAATDEVVLDSAVSWTSAGLEYDPLEEVFYASTGSGLYEIDPSTGGATLAVSLPTNNLTYIREETCE